MYIQPVGLKQHLSETPRCLISSKHPNHQIASLQSKSTWLKLPAQRGTATQVELQGMSISSFKKVLQLFRLIVSWMGRIQKFGEPQNNHQQKTMVDLLSTGNKSTGFASDLRQTHASVYPTRRLWSEHGRFKGHDMMTLAKARKSLPKTKKYGCHNHKYIFRFVYFLSKTTLSSRS